MINYSKIVPDILKKSFIIIIQAILIGLLFFVTIESVNCQGIRHYYIRYDLKSSKYRITDVNLLMIPSENEFRTEKFSYILTVNRISLTPGESAEDFNQKAKQAAIKSVLEKHGLKSVKTKDTDTVISYEGAIITPIQIIEKNCDTEASTCIVKSRLMFSPISFPDQWKKQKVTFRIKTFFKELFGLED